MKLNACTGPLNFGAPKPFPPLYWYNVPRVFLTRLVRVPSGMATRRP
jgi:hypothetical protein